MTYDQFNAFCSALIASSHVVQWGGSEVWKVGGKVFAIGGWEKELEREAYTFKVSDLNFDVLSEQQGYRPAPYLASRGMKWIQMYDTSVDTKEQLEYYINESHKIVSLGLSKKKQKELGLNQS